MATATFAAGCFWGVEAKFRRCEGVLDTVVGYAGGHQEQPSYHAVCGGGTGHAEAVQVTFDPQKIAYADLVKYFFSIHNPTTLNRQGLDVGEQYRSVIFTHDEEQLATAQAVKETVQAELTDTIVTDITPFKNFYRAEEYHQRYYDKQ